MFANHARRSTHPNKSSSDPTHRLPGLPRRWWILAGILAILALLVLAPQAIAIENVQGEIWTLPTLGSVRVSVVFDALVSDRDWNRGIAFDIALRESE